MTEYELTEEDVERQSELVDFVERCVAEARNTANAAAEHMRDMVWNEPGEAASLILCAYVLGDWDLNEQELARLWFLGRCTGYRREQLVPDGVLRRAAPGRGRRPSDPPGSFVQTPLLEGGGHGPGRARPGKREFPSHWSDDDTIRHTMDVARHPSLTVELPSGVFRATGERDGVQLSVLVSTAGQVLTSYPVDGDGVVQNPLDDERAPHVQRLRELLDQLLPASNQEPRRSLDELLTVGEWPHVIAALRALDVPLTPLQRDQLTELATLAE